jgi:hypothetical protein
MSMLELAERRHEGSTTKTFPNHESTHVGTKALQQKPRYNHMCVDARTLTYRLDNKGLARHEGVVPRGAFTTCVTT